MDHSQSVDFVPFKRSAVIGLGLIGGSLALALRERRIAEQIVGFDPDSLVGRDAALSCALDTATDTLPDAVTGADCVIVAAPVTVIPSVLAEVAKCASVDALVTDVGSTKSRIVQSGAALFGRRFVGGHPMAGSHERGLGAARADLFEGAPWAIVPCPAPGAEPRVAADRIAGMALRLGARPIFMTAEEHDDLAALVSHLPHLISYAFARTVAESTAPEGAREFGGPSFRDIVRVSRSDPSLWSGILLENADRLLEVCGRFRDTIDHLQAALQSRDAAALESALRTASPQGTPGTGNAGRSHPTSESAVGPLPHHHG